MKHTDLLRFVAHVVRWTPAVKQKLLAAADYIEELEKTNEALRQAKDARR